MKFAYIDKGGIMHVTEREDWAKEYSANGKYVKTDAAASGGYPLEGGEQIIVYSPEDMRLEAEGPKLEPIARLGKLYRQCE